MNTLEQSLDAPTPNGESHGGQHDNEAPVFGSWSVWYGLVVGVFALVVGVLAWFSKAFAS
jgi:hypothetical protein